MAYEGDVEWGVDIEGDLSSLVVHPRHPSNLVIGYIRDPLNYDRVPLPLVDWVVAGQMRIERAEKAWLGVAYQLIVGRVYYEVDQVFTAGEDWVCSPMKDYYIRTRADPKPYGEWFDFEVSLSDLLRYVGWELANGQVSRVGVAGDVEGYCAFGLEDLQIDLGRRGNPEALSV